MPTKKAAARPAKQTKQTEPQAPPQQPPQEPTVNRKDLVIKVLSDTLRECADLALHNAPLAKQIESALQLASSIDQ